MLLKSITSGCVEICWLLLNDLVEYAICSATSNYPNDHLSSKSLRDGEHPSLDAQELFSEVLYLKIGNNVIIDKSSG